MKREGRVPCFLKRNTFQRHCFSTHKAHVCDRASADYLPVFFTLSVIIFIITQVSRDNGSVSVEGVSLAVFPVLYFLRTLR